MLTTGRELHSFATPPPDRKDAPILWAIDPQNGVTPDVLALRFLTDCNPERGAKIQPLFVSPADPKGDSPQKTERLREQARQFVNAAGGENFAAPEILFASGAETDTAIERLVDEAEDRGARAIAVASHGESGLLSWWRGSFAERLLELSTVPVIFLPHRDTFAEFNTKRVLFCTDFSEHSHAALRKLGPLASAAGWSVILFHDVSLPIAAVCDAGGTTASGTLPTHYYADQKAWAEQEARRWQRDASEWGFAIERQIVVGGPGSIPHLILEYAERDAASAIALSTSDRPLSRWLLGSTAHAVFRANRYPVWVYGPQAK